MILQARSVILQGAERRSRVTPGSSCTMAMRLPAILLKMADFPTLGLPTMAMVGTCCMHIMLPEAPML